MAANPMVDPAQTLLHADGLFAPEVTDAPTWPPRPQPPARSADEIRTELEILLLTDPTITALRGLDESPFVALRFIDGAPSLTLEVRSGKAYPTGALFHAIGVRAAQGGWAAAAGPDFFLPLVLAREPRPTGHAAMHLALLGQLLRAD